MTTKENVKAKAAQGAQNAGKILGYWAYWDCGGIKIKRDDFLAKLDECGLEKSYAYEIRESSAFKRALEILEEDNVLTLVDETPGQTVYQVNSLEDEDDSSSEEVKKKVVFKYEARVAIIKDKIQTGDPNQFIWSDDKDLREKVVELFRSTKDLYTTTDFRKFIKRLFAGESDLIKMRKAGGLYFVPERSAELGAQVMKLFDSLPHGSNFDFVPMPDLENSRRALKRAVVEDAEEMLNDLNAKIEDLKGASEKRADTLAGRRIKEIRQLRDKVQMYAVYLEDKAKDLLTQAGELEDKTKEFLLQ